MSEFDRENDIVFQMVHENRRRSGITVQTGIVVPREDAERFCAWEARQKTRRTPWQETAFLAVAMVATAALVLGALL